jgi:putative membrane protein
MFLKTLLLSITLSSLIFAQEPQNPPTSKDVRRSPDQGSKTSPDAADRNSSTSDKSSMSGTQDRTFLQKVAMSGHKEVEIAKMATSRASNEEVKSLAQRLVDDHTKTNAEVADLARQKGVTLSTAHSMSSEHASDTSNSRSASTASANAGTDKWSGEFSNLSGQKFDQAFLKHVRNHHEKDIAAFEKQARSGSDADVKAFAEKTLPTLREHLAKVKSVQSGLSGKNNSGKPSTNNN